MQRVQTTNVKNCNECKQMQLSPWILHCNLQRVYANSFLPMWSLASTSSGAFQWTFVSSSTTHTHTRTHTVPYRVQPLGSQRHLVEPHCSISPSISVPMYDAWYGLARTLHIRCIYGIFGREITKYMVISVHIYGSGQPYAWWHLSYRSILSSVNDETPITICHDLSRSIPGYLCLPLRAPLHTDWHRQRLKVCVCVCVWKCVRVCMCVCLCVCVCVCVCDLCWAWLSFQEARVWRCLFGAWLCFLWIS